MRNLKYLLQVCTQSQTKLLQNPVCVCQHSLQRRHFYPFQSRNKEYHGRHLVGFSCEQMFDVVADIKNYKNFLPFCIKSYVVTDRPDFCEAALEIGFPPVVESYISRITLMRPHYAKAVCTDGKLFNHLTTTWKFSPGLKSNPYSCIVDCAVDFEFKSLFHSNLAHMFFDIVVQQMEGAFLVEAKKRYGKESLPSHALTVKKS